MLRPLVLLGFVGALVGCGTSINEHALGPNLRRPAKKAEDVVVFMDDAPEELHQDVVRYGCNFCKSHEKAIDEMKRLCASRGLDGIHTVRCAAPGTANSETCDGIGFVYSN